MFFLLIFTLASAFFSRYLIGEGYLPTAASFLTEACSLMMAAIILFKAIKSPEHLARGSFLVLFAFLALIFVAGIIINNVSPGTIFAALRNYLLAVPIFLFPFFYKIDENLLRRLFWILLLCAIIQLPVAYEQRMFTTFKGESTGDWTVGTIGNSGLLSIFLVLVSCLVSAAYVKRIFGFIPFLALTILVLSPTMLNETKATIVLASVGMLAIFALGGHKGTRVRTFSLGLATFVVFGAIFIQVYDYFMVPRWGYGLVDFVLMEGRLEGYLTKGATVGSSRVGILDGLFAPIQHVHEDVVRWFFGYGAGNISDSALGSQFTGKYFYQFEGLSVGTAGQLVLELGFPAFLLSQLFIMLVANDSFRVSERSQGMGGVFALATTGAAVVIPFAMIYRNILDSSAICLTFALLAGYVISCRQLEIVWAQTDRNPVSERSWVRVRG